MARRSNVIHCIVLIIFKYLIIEDLCSHAQVEFRHNPPFYIRNARRALIPKREVARELYKFLVAHIPHNRDNVVLAKSKRSGTTDNALSLKDEQTYIDWVRTTTSDDTSCPVSFLFFTDLISERGRNCFEGARASYLSKSLCRQLATMCRQYNDLGSAERDAAECNLNSLDFPEFQRFPSQADWIRKTNGSDMPTHGLNSRVGKPPDGDGASLAIAERHEQESSGGNPKIPEGASAKEDLMAIAEYERSCMQLTLETLTDISPPATIRKIRVFIDVTDIFGQIYVHKDLSSRAQLPAQ
ncbi:hypothetical protein XPA_005107 [Xanthoria parietina]